MSDSSIELSVWLLKANGVDAVPSLSQVKTTRSRLEDNYGVRSIETQGALGHVYTMNSIPDLITQVCRFYIFTDLSIHRLNFRNGRIRKSDLS